MKRIVIAIAGLAMLLMGATPVFAQGKYGADSAECIKYLSYYQDYYKQRNYDDAIPNWRMAYKLCPPTASQNLILHGTTLVRQLLAKRDISPEQRKGLVDTLLTLHDLRAEYYPSYAVTARNNKGIDMSNYVKDDNKRLYDTYSSIIKANGPKVDPKILFFHLNAAIERYREGGVQTEDVINAYNDNIALLDNVAATTDEEKASKSQVKNDIENIFLTSRVASCESLLELYTPRLEADPNNLALVTTIARIMSNTEGCQDNDLYLKAVTAMYNLDPSYNSAYFLYRLNSVRGNASDAIKYLEEAIASPESDDLTDAGYYYELAAFSYKNGQSGRAVEAARKAVDLDPSLAGKTNMLLGTIWGNLRCGGNEVERAAPFWVAVDYLQKARAADPELAEEANRMIAQFSRYFPKTADAFMYDVQDGQSYTVSCSGLRATTTVRTQK
jgi:tetratricopeptide (TPR) repeat protein